jgi:serine protease
MNFVNGSDSFGHGYFDGFSIVGGHEYAEAATDPFPNSGWLDGAGAENGDKCAWISSGQGASTNITLGSNYYAVQSLWSNAFNGGAGGCVISYP